MIVPPEKRRRDIYQAFVKDVFNENVETAREEAKSTEEVKIPVQKRPLLDRRVIFSDHDFAEYSFLKVLVSFPPYEQDVKNGLEKLANTASGKWLLNTLSLMFFDSQKGEYTVKVYLWFKEEIQVGVDTECGEIKRLDPKLTEYWLYLKIYRWTGEKVYAMGEKLPPGQTSILRCGDKWPPVIIDEKNKDWVMRVCFIDDNAAMMAECIYHELLHVWFIKGGADKERQEKGLKIPKRKYRSGHEEYTLGKFDQDFHDKLKEMNAELNKPFAKELEAVLKESGK